MCGANTAFYKNNSRLTVTHGRGGVMVRGGFAASGLGHLVIIDRTINPTQFH